jgi:hypothetical protein
MRGLISSILVGSLGCSTVHAPAAAERLAAVQSPRLENLRRAATLPWLDDGVCAVREAAGEWRLLVERCYHALDLSRIRFQDPDHRCAVASTETVAMAEAVAVCLLVQPELLVVAVVVVGVVIVAAAIAAELEKSDDCDELFTVCLGTRIQSIPGPKHGHGQCHACRDVCRQYGTWPEVANGKPCR